MSSTYGKIRLIHVIIFGFAFASLLIGCADRKAKNDYQAGQMSQNHAEYKIAIQQYRSIIQNYPNTQWADSARSAIAVCEDKLNQKIKNDYHAGQLSQNHAEYKIAIQRYRSIIQDYPNTKFADSARSAIEVCEANLKKEEEAREKARLALKKALEKEFRRYGTSKWIAAVEDNTKGYQVEIWIDETSYASSIAGGDMILKWDIGVQLLSLLKKRNLFDIYPSIDALKFIGYSKSEENKTDKYGNYTQKGQYSIVPIYWLEINKETAQKTNYDFFLNLATSTVLNQNRSAYQAFVSRMETLVDDHWEAQNYPTRR